MKWIALYVMFVGPVGTQIYDDNEPIEFKRYYSCYRHAKQTRTKLERYLKDQIINPDLSVEAFCKRINR